jgi:CheY-like chemotaxis protein
MPIRTIWLADDDDDDCIVFNEAVNELTDQTKVTCISNGVDLINRLMTGFSLPDLLFIDINMPLKNGMSCLREIKSAPQLNHLPVVIWSTSGVDDDVTEAFRLGARLFIQKPSSFTKFKEIIQKVLIMDLTKSVEREYFRL